MNQSLIKSIVGWFLFISAVAAIILLVNAAVVQANKEAQRKHDFQIICEHAGGHAATFTEGETYVCIRNGEVVKP